MTPALEIDLLRTFLAIAETGNFSRAAERVARTPSAVSLQVKRLEEAAGQRLFHRSTREIALSEAGETLLFYARRILVLHDEAASRLAAPRIEGRIRFGAPNDSGIYAIPQMLRRFARTHPHVDVDVRLGMSAALHRACDAGELDLAIYTNEADRPSLARPIFEEDLVWIGCRGGVAATRRPLPLAVAETGCGWRARALDALARTGIGYRVAYSSEHCQGQIAAVEADLAVAPLPVSIARAPFTRIGPDAGLPELGRYGVFLQVRQGAHPAAEALAQHVRESFAAAEGLGQRLFA
ncbi:LysR family transcriptional regulator [Aureimonas endophytica]|uniref:LysR family transcriptional regulator n=1 Tax=Aureimonas endophytica TaxID=2027858 RepID=A0A916ZTB7_9HYPH|nr:LysR substrate-binding domain-containing protein [Aureimonas endophytica]GGE13049.1 LysR family transcriptional regulator [Aureimonas endophytica]